MPDLAARMLLHETLGVSTNAIAYRLGAALAAVHPGFLETKDDDFDLERFHADGHCTLEWHPEVHPQVLRTWQREEPHLGAHMQNAWARVVWNDAMLDVVRVVWVQGYGSQEHRYFVLGDRRETVEAFFSAVCAWCHPPRREILVYRGGCWSRSREMYAAVEDASFDDLILAGALKEEVRSDLERFLGAREEYAHYRVPYKRGLLFVGPPGNGKTHCLRACIRRMAIPCLYVQSIASRFETEDANITEVFARARSLTPCCLVFEDLDAMITGKNRSAFLNQLDGFEQNDGILTIATTNHPERLDPSIVDRPSRFDRKYHFELPGTAERLAYISMWNGRLDRAMRVTTGEAEEIASETEGFSFAYVKELFVSSMVKWMAGPRAATLAPILVEQLGVLRSQMTSERAAGTTLAAPLALGGGIDEDDE
jgi:hypothetical protein